MTPEESLLLFTVLAIFLPSVMVVILAPLRTRHKIWHTFDSGFEPSKSNSLPRDAGKIVAVIESLGFINLGNWTYDGFSAGTARITLLEHPQTLDVAKVMIAKIGFVRYLSFLFQTRFEDGTEIATANTPVISGMPVPPDQTTVWLPAIHDAGFLYDIHSQAIDAQISRKRRIRLGPEHIDYLAAGRNRLLTFWVETGYYYLDEGSNVYRPTWKGAFVITWKSLWPLRVLYRKRRLQQTHELLRDLGVHLDQN